MDAVSTECNIMESRIVELEIRVAHQEVTLQELNDVIVRQQRLIDRLVRDLDVLRQQLQAQARLLATVPAAEETPPPHY